LGHDATDSGGDPVVRAIASAHGVLPDQGPIGVFIHHNTLHAYQHLPFHQAIQAGAARIGARAYMPEADFRDAFRRGRIGTVDLDDALKAALGRDGDVALPLGLTRRTLRRALLTEAIDGVDVPGLEWRIRNGPSPVLPDEALWHAACARVAEGPAPSPVPGDAPRRHRDVLVACGAADPDIDVTHELVLLASAFLDQGQAVVALPGREHGFLAAVSALFAAGAHVPRACRGAEEDFRRIAIERTPAHAVIVGALDALGVPDSDRMEFVLATALALPGWGGMFSRLERHPSENRAGCPASLEEFLAVRFVLDRHAVPRAAADAGLPATWELLKARQPVAAQPGRSSAAFLLWGLARAAGAGPDAVRRLGGEDLAALWREVAAFTANERGRVWLEAYEGRYRRAVLGAVAQRRSQPAPDGQAAAQFIFCIDEREESIRRALEEQDPGFRTFGAAGFFGMAIDYLGLYDEEPAAHCPVVVTPAHEVHENPLYTERDWHARRAGLRERWHGTERAISRWSRSLTGGAGLSLVLGPFAGAIAASRVLAPRGTHSLRERLSEALAPRPDTRLGGLRTDAAEVRPPLGKPLGFSLSEATDRVSGVLRSIGLVRDFAPVVVVLGHGSTSLNNPHESAHDCGACGGRRGGANARLFADLANRADVRSALRTSGIDIPDGTWFVGALHDTADDGVTCFDLDTMPPSCAPAFDRAVRALEVARRLSAQERARRFDDAPLGLDPDSALRHVESRAASLAQPRPEYGHCTNAVAFVGRRAMTRGIHLDRRAFLVSYDPSDDPGDLLLERILAAVGPVGAGISLEYYFSSVDNDRFGCGTKLPHNVTGLLGVMNGHRGDLRTGLPLQMVELHEPMRLLLVVEASVDSLLAVAARQPGVLELVKNEWIQLVSVDPTTGRMQRFHDGAFHDCRVDADPLPMVRRSVDWHGACRDFVAPALVLDGLGIDGGRP
jgi:uncharacterized protein YbcC (UPF0753/DUF2309 family)